MGERLKPIVGKSPILEEKRIREEKERRQKRLEVAARRRKRQQKKAIATLVFLMCIIVFGIGAIVKLVTDAVGDNKSAGNNGGGSITSTEPDDNNSVVSQSDVLQVGLTDEDYIYDCQDTEIMGKLSNKAKSNKMINYIYENYKAYPEEVLKALSNNSELADFAIKYPLELKKQHDKVTTVEDMYEKGEMPLFIQWDDRWGYYPYGDDVLGLSGCGPTCLSMVIVSLTGKNQYTPTAIADFATENGYYVADTGTAWALFNEGVKKLGLNSRTIGKNENEMKGALDKGEILILSMGPGIFTTGGHYIVIYDYNEDTGEFIIKDPNSVIRTNTTYMLESFKDQIKNIWAISK